MRKDKLMRILKTVEPETPVKFVSMAGATEINSVRPAFQTAYAVINKMQVIKEKAEAEIKQ